MRCTSVILGMLMWVPGLALAAGAEGVDSRSARRQWLSDDVHLAGEQLLTHRASSGRHWLVFQRGFSMILAGRQLTSDQAVVWIEAGGGEMAAGAAGGHEIRVYLKGQVSSERATAAQTLDLREVVIERGRAVVIQARIGGEVYVTAEERETADPRGLPAYEEAVVAFGRAGLGPSAGPLAPSRADVPRPEAMAAEGPTTGYTVGIAPLGDVAPTFQLSGTRGAEVVTVIGRIYVSWQEQALDGAPPEVVGVQADSLVLWRQAEDTAQPSAGPSPMQQEGVSEIYVSGDVLLTEGQRTIRADELYYDLRRQRGIVSNAVMRSFDASRNVPVYVRAKELRRLSQSQFEGDEITLTTSEFWTPQISAGAAKVRITDRMAEVQQDGPVPESSYSAEMEDVRFKYYDVTLLRLPSVRSNLLSPTTPIKSVRVGHDSAFGPSIETQWFLSRILGLREPEGTDSTLFLDYYGDRGLGGGAAVEYERENYFGRLLGYAIYDEGEDRLGRTRKNVEVPDDMRGRFKFQHRHYLPRDWQLTAETSYLSDKNFLEQYYRGEFYTGKEQETLVHLKRIEANRGVAFLGKTRINDFADKVEELPSAEYHWTGQSLFDDRFVFFSDSQASRLRYRYGSDGPTGEPDEFFTFVNTRNELDMPLHVGRSSVVPFVAGSFGYDDGTGFQEELDGMSSDDEDAVWIGEAGVRMSAPAFWRVYPDVESRLWDLDQLRHIIRPSITAVSYAASDAVAEQRDTLDLGISQRWQTKRGPAGRRRTVDWFELDVDFVWVNASGDATAGPDRFVWNQPFIPLINRAGDRVAPQDRRTTDIFGPQRNYASAVAAWRLSETMSVLGDVYVDMNSGVVDQLDLGFSRLVWPNLSYFIGSRYLRDVENGLGQEGSNAFTFAATYVLDPRYTAVFAQQYDFDYGANIRSDITLIRKYHRLNLALTFSADESLDEERIVLSLWPEGVPELSVGLRRYMGLGASETVY